MLPKVLSLKEQDAVISEVLRERLDKILPKAMEEAGIDMWVIACNEDNYDPIYLTMTPMFPWSPILSILVFYQKESGAPVEKFNLSRVDTRDFYERRFVPNSNELQLLKELIEEKQPNKIGLNIGRVNWAAGGLTYNLYKQIVETIPEKFTERIVSAEKACEKWGMTLTDREIVLHQHAGMLSKAIIKKCFSREYVTPGVTTASDLCWAYWQEVNNLGLEVSFQPYFTIVRPGAGRFSGKEIIQNGDFIVNDVGLKYLRLNTDHQQWAYVLKPNESNVPEEYNALFKEAQKLQNIFMSEFEKGLSGNALLNKILNRAKKEGVSNPRVYSHSLGLFLHEPGPLIGLPWEQKNTQGRGEVILDYNTAFTMETSIEMEISGNKILFNTEEDVVFTENGCNLQVPAQKEFLLI